MLPPYLTISDTLTSSPRTSRTCVADYAALKAWFALTPGFTAYDAAKWAQITERACHGYRQALARLDAAGFSLMVTTRL
nr:MAG TPA: hypothetical protein [Caudoviricetes sp.]